MTSIRITTAAAAPNKNKKGKKKMKKIVLTMVALMTLTLSSAKTEGHRPVRNAESFDMSVDMRRLAAKLDLTDYQMEAVEVIHNCLNNEMQEAATARGHKRMAMVHQSVGKTLHQMHRVLNENQFRTYAILLGTTLHNRGL